MAAADATDRARYLHELHATFLGTFVDLQISQLVKFHGLNNAITTLYEPSHYRLGPTEPRIKDYFEL